MPARFEYIKINNRFSNNTVSLTKCYVIRYTCDLWKITSIQCTFVVNKIASTIKRKDHSSCMAPQNGLFVWLLHTDGVQTYIQYCPSKVYSTNNEPGTTRRILFRIIIFKLVLIHVIYKLFSATHSCNNILHLPHGKLLITSSYISFSIKVLKNMVGYAIMAYVNLQVHERKLFQSW